MNLEPISPANREAVNAFLRKHWFSTTMAVRGTLFDLAEADGMLAREEGAIVGLVTWRLIDDACEILSLDSVRENRGVGSALMAAAEDFARGKKRSRMLLVTTNDNLHAQRFYARRGYRVVRIYPDAVAAARRLKPEIPEFAGDGTPIRDEVEMEKSL